MQNNRVKKLVMAALLAALCCLGTILFVIPLPGSGYANFGDCFVVLSGLILGPVWGGAAAGLGTMLADILSGFAFYAPATFVIKALMAMAAWGVFRALRHRRFLGTALASLVAELIMVTGYFLYETVLYGAAAAALNLIGNGVQGGASIVLATVIWSAALRTKIAERLVG